MSDQPPFLFITCQIGAERAVKGELARRWPDFRFAFSRPGFLTFKLPPGLTLPPDFDLEAVFARSYGFSLGKVTGGNLDTLARRVWQLYGNRPVQQIHAWERDRAEPGEYGFEPAITPAAVAAYEAIRRAAPRGAGLQPNLLSAVGSDTHPKRQRGPRAVPSLATGAGVDDAGDEGGRTPALHGTGLKPELWKAAQPGDWVLDCVLVDPGQWWVGYHQARSLPSRWPGGMIPLEMPPEAVSRAWLKTEEALLWSQLPVPRGARWVELGSSPGGASQALLARGLEVIGIDPAEMHPSVLADPHFRHIRRRVPQVPRRAFRKIRWLAADMNVAPNYTLDAVEAIVTHPEVNIRGMLLTLKLLNWNLANDVPGYLERVRGWGYNFVRARQLQHNHREFCITALQKPFQRKPLK
jgi:23S rRNA (cytidine2498-2'-O)-methyltransferase